MVRRKGLLKLKGGEIVVIRVNIQTGEEIVIEPINDEDRKGLKKVIENLYYINQDRVLKGQPRTA